MTAETLEYIRGRDDWRVHTENKLQNLYSRQSSNISIREEIDSDEYHHDRKLSDLIEIAYLDSEGITSLPSSYEDNKVFERYYLELQQIEGQLSNDIQKKVAQKQVILLDSNEIESSDGYIYPLPDIIIDQVSDHGEGLYTIEQLDSDYSNLSESEDDVQSVIEVNHGSDYEGEIITTLDMDGDMDEMIEVTLWDLNDDTVRELSSKESSVEIISIPNETLMEDESPIRNQVYVEQSDEVLLTFNPGHASNTSEVTETREYIENYYSETANDAIDDFITALAEDVPENVTLLSHEGSTENTSSETLNDRCENINILTLEDAKNKDVNTAVNNAEAKENISTIENETASETTNSRTENIEESSIKSKPPPHIKTENNLLRKHQQHNTYRPSAGNANTTSFIEHEKLASAQECSATTDTVKKSSTSKTTKKYEAVDDLIKEGCMGVWFHN